MVIIVHYDQVSPVLVLVMDILESSSCMVVVHGVLWGVSRMKNILNEIRMATSLHARSNG